MGLSTVEMKEVGELLNESFLSVFSNSSAEHHQKLLQFSFSLIRREIPYQIFSGNLEGTKHVIDIMYGDAEVRDFVLAITFQFFAKFGNTRERYSELVQNLAEGIGFVKPEDKKDALLLITTPSEILERMPSIEDVEALLIANRWMVTIALMMLYLVTPEDLAELQRLRREQLVEESRKKAATK